MSKRAILFTIVAGLIALMVIGIAPLWEVHAESRATRAFTIDQSMARVRKILVRTNAAKKIVAGADAELLDQKWLNMAFELPRPILSSDWHIEGDGQLTVQANDAYLGQHAMTLNQRLDITAERLHVTNQLNGQSRHANQAITAYRSAMTLSPGAQGQASFETSLTIEVTTRAGLFTRGMVAQGIRDAAGRSLEQQEAAVRAVVAEQDGKWLVLPQSL
jgi:hypothetical protein